MSVRRLDSAGEPVFGKKTSVVPASSEAVAIQLAMNLKLIQGEWFLDQTAGVAWLDSALGNGIFGGGADLQFLESEVKRVTLGTAGVSALLSFDLAFDHETRRAAVFLVVSDIYGEAIPVEVVIP
jgi:hypothetical protein